MALMIVLCVASTQSLAADIPDAPFVTPSVDVDVTYESPSGPGGQMAQLRTRWQAAGLQRRDDPGDSVVYMVTSWRTHTLTVVDTARHLKTVMPAPGDDIALPGHKAEGKFLRLGQENVAGEVCDLWQAMDQDGQDSEVCYTSDGILLKALQGGRVVIQATHVVRAPQADSLFLIPSDYASKSAAGNGKR